MATMFNYESVNAQIPTYSNILTFTSPVVLIPTNTNSISYGGGYYPNQNPQVQVSSVGSCRYLIVSLNGSKNGLDLSTNISVTRYYSSATNYTQNFLTNINTNYFIPSGAVLVFAMNPTNKTVTSTVPVFKLTNSTGQNYGAGCWNITNGFYLCYNTSLLTTNFDAQVTTAYYTNPTSGTVTEIPYIATNKTIYIDRWVPQNVFVCTTNNGSSWLTNNQLGSKMTGYLSDSGEWNHDLTNNYYAVLCKSNTNTIVYVYRMP